MRFAAVISHPIQHYSPIFTELARRNGVTVKVFYLTDHGVKASYDSGFGASFEWDVPLTEGHDHEFLLPGVVSSEFSFLRLSCPGLPAKLEEFRPDAIWLHGYAYLANWRALHWARHKSAVLYFGDSELLHHRNLAAKFVKKPVLRWFFSRCDAFMTIGDNNENYYRHYGAPKEKFVRGACPIDIARFTFSANHLRELRRAGRAKLSIPPDAFTVVFNGKMQDYKRPLDIVQALDRLNKEGETSVHVLFIGTGPLLEEMKALTSDLGLERRVHFPGFVNQSKMPAMLATGDAVAVTSERDAHPLAVTEGLPFGMPIIASDKVGCVGPTDTAQPGVNTLVYPCGDTEALAAHVRTLAGDRGLYTKYSEASRKIAPSQDISVAADAVLEAWSQVRREKFGD